MNRQFRMCWHSELGIFHLRSPSFAFVQLRSHSFAFVVPSLFATLFTFLSPFHFLPFFSHLSSLLCLILFLCLLPLSHSTFFSSYSFIQQRRDLPSYSVVLLLPSRSDLTVQYRHINCNVSSVSNTRGPDLYHTATAGAVSVYVGCSHSRQIKETKFILTPHRNHTFYNFFLFYCIMGSFICKYLRLTVLYVRCEC